MRYLTGAALAGALIAAPALAVAAPQSFTLEKSHTDVAFTIDHLGFTKKHGQFRDVDGTLTLDPDNPGASKVDVTAKAGSVETFFAARDKDLVAANFFDAAKYPDIRFVSTAVKVTGKDTADITGDLTLHGVTKPLVLHAKLNKLGTNPLDRKNTAGFSATGSLKRSDYGMKTFLPMIGDDVTIMIETEFNQPAAGGPPPAR